MYNDAGLKRYRYGRTLYWIEGEHQPPRSSSTEGMRRFPPSYSNDVVEVLDTLFVRNAHRGGNYTPPDTIRCTLLRCVRSSVVGRVLFYDDSMLPFSSILLRPRIEDLSIQSEALMEICTGSAPPTAGRTPAISSNRTTLGSDEKNTSPVCYCSIVAHIQ